MKRFFLLTLLCLVAATAEAYDFSLSAPTGQTLYYSYVSSDEVKVVAPNGTSWGTADKPTGAMTLPGHVTYGGTTYTVQSVGMRAFAGCTELTQVTIQEGVRSIDMMAFSGCTSLASISLPTSLERIAAAAFDGTAFYTTESNWGSDYVLMVDGWVIRKSNVYGDTVRVKKGTVGLANSSFMGCDQVRYVQLPATVRYMGESTFQGCTGMDTIRLLATKPPQLADNTFQYLSGFTVAVPCSTAVAYLEAPYWADLSIVEDTCHKGPWPIIGIEQSDEPAFALVPAAWGVTVEGAEGMPLRVSDMTGRQVFSTECAGPQEQISLPAAGIYVVHAGGSVKKLIYLR